MPALKQLSPEVVVLLAKKGLKQENPIFVRIFKEESELEVWKQKEDGRFYHFKTYPICTWSGGLGPKIRQGDKQSPEGFYTVTPGQMNPNSKYHLAFNLGYPNAYDKANGRTGDALMVHGDCKSVGCFAMTDALIEEIYILARESFQAGQRQFQVHAFPFRMTEANMARYKKHEWYSFWQQLKEGYDTFEATQLVPKVNVCSKQYLLNANFFGQEAVPDPQSSCPAYKKVQPTPFDPFNQGGPSLIQAAAPDATALTNVAAANSQSRPAEPAVKPFAVQALQSSGAPQAAPSAQVTPPAQAAPVLAGGAPQYPPVAAQLIAPRNVQPVAATYLSHPGAPAQPEVKKPVETRGIHNVVESGKSDMIITAPAQPTTPPTSQYTYGQANTAGTAPALR